MSDNKTTKFTPAPWVQNGVNGVHTKNGNCVATTHMEGIKKEDAALIAQAPAMYNLLSEILEWIDGHDCWWIDTPGRGGFDTDKIRSILTAARGGSGKIK